MGEREGWASILNNFPADDNEDDEQKTCREDAAATDAGVGLLNVSLVKVMIVKVKQLTQ
jgi:hypothetical protein